MHLPLTKLPAVKAGPWTRALRLHHAGVLSTAVVWSKHQALLQPQHLRKVPVVGPWLARQAHRLSSRHKRTRGTARSNAGDAAMRRVGPHPESAQDL